MHRVETFSEEGPSSTETPVTDTNITGWRDDCPSTAVVGSTYATKRTDKVVPVLLGTNHCSRPCGCHSSQTEPDPRDNTGRDCPKCRSTLQKQPKRWKLGSVELDDKQVPDRQKFCAPHAGVYMALFDECVYLLLLRCVVTVKSRMEKCRIWVHLFPQCLRSSDTHTDRLAELTPKNRSAACRADQSSVSNAVKRTS